MLDLGEESIIAAQNDAERNLCFETTRSILKISLVQTNRKLAGIKSSTRTTGVNNVQ
jgi:hypothetical protein